MITILESCRRNNPSASVAPIMSTSTHPRRRPALANDTPTMTPPSLIDSFQKMSLAKGRTFHNPLVHDLDLFDPLTAKAPRRSSTCPKALEDLMLGSGERRTGDLVRNVTEAAGTGSKDDLEKVLLRPEVLPVPTFTVSDTAVDEIDHAARKMRPAHARHSHSSDSGLGSSIADSTEVDAARKGADATHHFTLEVLTHSPAAIVAIEESSDASDTDSTMSRISAATEERGLSNYACEQIHKHIVKPILLEEELKHFHPLIKKVPRKIGNKEIKTLRDLEKTLIFLAPDYSVSAQQYLDFCERTIRVLHTTVTTLHESDLRKPAERPYTQGYFFDLVEQIRRYAEILAATRAREERGEEPDEMDVSPDERISIRGGMTHTGEPAELVREKDGKVISIATGRELPAEDLVATSTKRHMSDAFHEDDDEALRSMARRKKNAKPEIHECHVCDKEFKRPCDLTKHVKTHERPWKCPDETCKYHAHGWPTEKERDRHVNDKHSAAPSLYHCLFKPCPYTSKRESNCKQHMEKAHGWEYVRSKSNGKGKAPVPGTRLPHASVPQSPASALLTPLTPIAPSPSVQSWSTSSARDSMPPPSMPGPSHYGTPALMEPSPDFSDHFQMDFDFNNMAQTIPSRHFPITPALSEERRGSSVSSHPGLQFDGSAYEDAISPAQLNFDNFRFGPHDFTFPQQQITPHSSIAAGSSSAVMSHHNLSVEGGSTTHTSPGGQLDQTFTDSTYYDGMHIDQEFANDYAGPGGDFTLFSGGMQTNTSGGEMFQPLTEGSNWDNFGGQFDPSRAPNLQSTSSALDELFPELKGH